MNDYKIIGWKSLQANKTVPQIIKDTAVACGLVSDGASIEECSIYSSVILSCLMDTIISNADSVKNQEVILYSNDGCQYRGGVTTLTFSKNKHYEDIKQYVEECRDERSIYCYGFDIKALSGIISRFQSTIQRKMASSSEDNIYCGRYNNNNEYYHLQINAGMQTLLLRARHHIFPLKLRGIFSFYSEDCGYDEFGNNMMSYNNQQSNDYIYLEALSDEDLTNVILITVPTVLCRLSKFNSVSEPMLMMAKNALENLKRNSSNFSQNPFLI